jgi:hypothetical protein
MACNDYSNGSCEGTVGPDYGLNPDGTINTDSNQRACVPTRNNRSLTPNQSDDLRCKPFQLENERGNQYIDRVVNEALNIGGATLNIYKLLGVHEQGKLVDCTGRGEALSNGDLPNFPAANAFDMYITEWRSIQRGNGVLASAYIGYDFGNIKTNDDTRRAYGVDTSIYKHVATIAIKQSAQQTRRVTRARIERSDDGIKWRGVSIVLFPDDNCLNTVQFKHSVPSRYWRIRPLDFNGVVTDDVWAVPAIQMFHNYIATDEYNIQDMVLLENRDRDYATDEIPIKGYYDLMDNLSELTAFGLEVPSMTMYITVSFSACVAALGRPIVVGDIVEIPSEAQYSAEMKRILKWMEVTDVSWATEGYTPGWQPTLLRIVVQPAFVSQETQDIFGDLGETLPDGVGTVSGEDGKNPIYQDYFDVSQTIEAEARDAVPERGAEGSSTIRAWEESEIVAAAAQGVPNLQKIGLNPTGLYVEDAMPPNNAPFTEADTYPASPNHGDYHRLTYTGLAGDIPARLYRYSSSKGRWIYMETDLRDVFNPAKPTLKEFITSPNAVSNSEITRNRETIDKDCE